MSRDKPKESCGIFGIYGPGEDIANLTYFGILALQHRGQESAGIATSDGQRIKLEKLTGRVDRFTEAQIRRLSGGESHPAIIGSGHVRYSNTGSNICENYQPFLFQSRFGRFALSHNGNLLEPEVLQRRLIDNKLVPEGTSDSELIALLIVDKSYEALTFEEAIRLALKEIVGAYSLVIMTTRKLIGIRDPWGIRPLSLGKINSDHFLLSSETCAFEPFGGEHLSDLGPGEMIVIEDGKYCSSQLLPQVCKNLCIFEFIYFASPGSILYDRLLQTARRHMGERLFEEHPVKIDNPNEWVVGGVPNTGTPGAKGYAEASGLEIRELLLKNGYIGRTFIQPSQRLRSVGVRSKLQVLPREVRGKKVVLVEDSIVRGTTTGQIVNLLFKAGAQEVHMRITSPPYKYRCLMGIDTQYPEELIAATKSVDEIRQEIGATSLGYLSLEGVIQSINHEKSLSPIPSDHFCSACFNGQYPFKIPEAQNRFVLEQTV